MTNPKIDNSIVFFAFCAAFIWGAFIGRSVAKHNERTAAIEAGVAEWRIDPKTGDKEFVYITNEFNNE